MTDPMFAKAGPQLCIGLSTEAEVAPGESGTATATIDRPGLVESLIFQSVLVPMDRFSFKVEWARGGAVREVCSGPLLQSRVQLADIPGCASVLVYPNARLHLTMQNATQERRHLRATAWLVELPEGPGCLDVSTGPWPGGRKPFESGDD